MAKAKTPTTDLATTSLLETLEKSITELRALTECGICSRPFYEPYIISCGHTFCFSCLQQYFITNNLSRKTCPTCRQPVKHEPAPNYGLRDITHKLISQPELLLQGETTQKHSEWASEEASLLQRARLSSKAAGGLFGFSFDRPRAIRDTEDGVQRCPHCNWELEYGSCSQCGFYDNGTESERADSSSLSDGDDASSSSSSPYRGRRTTDFIDLDPSEVSDGVSSNLFMRHIAGSRGLRRRRSRTNDLDAESQSSDDETGSLTRFVVDDDNISIRSSSSTREEHQAHLDGELADVGFEHWAFDLDRSASDDHSSMSQESVSAHRRAIRRRFSTNLDSRIRARRSSTPGLTDTARTMQLHPHASASDAAPNRRRARPRRVLSPMGTSRSGNSQIAPIEIDSSSGDDSGTLQNARNRATGARSSESNATNYDDSDEGGSLASTQLYRHRPRRSRVLDSDEEDVEETASASSSRRSSLRPNLRGGGDSSSDETTPTRDAYASTQGSNSATVHGTNLTQTPHHQQARRMVYDFVGYSSADDGGWAPSPERPSSPSSSHFGASSSLLTTESPRSRSPSHCDGDHPHPYSSSSPSVASTRRPASTPTLSSRSLSSSHSLSTTIGPAAQSQSPSTSMANPGSSFPMVVPDHSNPDSSDRASSVESYMSQAHSTAIDQATALPLQTSYPSYDEADPSGNKNDRQRNRLANSHLSSGRSSGADRSRLHARKEERRRAKAERKRQIRAHNASSRGPSGPRLESLAA